MNEVTILASVCLTNWCYSTGAGKKMTLYNKNKNGKMDALII